MPRSLPAVALLLVAPFAAAADPGVNVTARDGAVDFSVGSVVVARYHHGPKAVKPYLYPLLAPGGVPVTRAWPLEPVTPGGTIDHPHHVSVWFTHGDVIPEDVPLKIKTAEKGGKGVDFWSVAKALDGTPRHGTIACVSVREPKPVAGHEGRLATVNEWKTPDGVKILDETRAIHLHALPAGNLFVFEIDLHASVCPITFGDTKEGSFGVRVHDSLREANKTAPGKLTTPAGSGEKAVWGHPADWCDDSGTVDGKAVGLAVFDDPKNPVRASWHARAYGLLAANPFGRNASGFPSQKSKTDPTTLAKGDHLKLRYAVYAHTGDAVAGKVAEAYEVFKKGGN